MLVFMNTSQPLHLSDILTKAFTQTKQNFVAFLPLILIVLVAVNYTATSYLAELDLTSEAGLAQLQSKANMVTIISLLLTPIEVGFMLMGVKAARGLSLKPTDIIAILPDSAKIVILAIISFILVQAGMMLLILPGLFLLVMLSMAQPLMCDYRLPMIEAIKRSAKGCYQHTGLVIQMYLILFILIVLSFFTFGIGLIFTIPFYVNAKGILYCQLYDTQPITELNE